MPYTKQVWQDLSLNHPLSAVRMNYIEQGIENATTKAETADAKAVRPLNQLTAPTADVSLNNKKITSLATPTAGADAATKDYVDGNGGVILSTVTARGDLLVATAAGALARLGAGADGQLLVVDPTQPTGVRWANKPTLSELGAPTADVSLNSKKIINLGEPDAATDAATKAYVDANVSSAPGSAYDARQIGELMVWTGKTNPTADYALLNGQRLTKLAFPQGYAFAQAEVAAGNTDWTVRTSDETFTVPDYSNRFIYSHGAKALTAKGGAEAIVLNETQMPVHGHSVNALNTGNDSPDHSHGASGGGAATTDWQGASGVTGWGGQVGRVWTINQYVEHLQIGGASARHQHTVPAHSTNNAGGGQPHNNMPPYVVLAHFVKVRGAVISGDAIQGPPGPQGEQGLPGATGPKGDDGALATNIEVYGHSGFDNEYDGADGTDRRAGDVLAGMLHASIRDYSVMGAVLTIDEDSYFPGGYVRCLQRSAADRQVNTEEYVSKQDTVLVWYGFNDFDLAPDLAAVEAAYKSSLRTVISRALATTIFEDTHASWSWGAGSWATVNATLYNSGAGFRKSTAATAAATINVPASFPGGTIAVGSLAQQGATSTYEFTVDGAPRGTLSAANASPVPNFSGGLVHRITGLTPGAHTIQIAATKGTSPGHDGVMLDYWQVEGPARVLVLKQPPIGSPSGLTNWTDSRRAALNAATDAVVAEFGLPNVAAVDLHAALNNAANTPEGVDLRMFRSDQLHPSARGHARIALAVYEKLLGMPLAPEGVGRRRLAARPVANTAAPGTVVGRLEVAMPDGSLGYVPVHSS